MAASYVYGIMYIVLCIWYLDGACLLRFEKQERVDNGFLSCLLIPVVCYNFAALVQILVEPVGKAVEFHCHIGPAMSAVFFYCEGIGDIGLL